MSKKRVIGYTAVFAAGILGLAGCGAGGMTNTASSAVPAAPAALAAASAAPAAPAAPAAATPTSATAKVGDAITLTGNESGEQASVLVTKVVDPTASTDDFSTAAAGSRYVAVQFQITNTGTAVYSDSPSNGARVADPTGQQFDSSMVSTVSAGVTMPSMVKLMPGEKAMGYVVFEVPTGSPVSKIQFGMDSGFGTTGEWTVS